MFAFAIVERDTGRLVLARDRLGIKPLYLAETPGRLRFASTLPALVAGGDVDTSLDPIALHHYLSFHSVVPAPRTILTGVRKLPPATVRDRRGRRPDDRRGRTGRRLTAAIPSARSWTAEDWQEAVLERLRIAVKRRMVADVPVGVLLSGGIDSSLVVALLAGEGQTRSDDLQHRLRGRRRRVRRRVLLLRPHRRAFRHPPPPDPDPDQRRAAGGRAGHRRDERADGQPRLRGVLPAVAGGLEDRQGGAVGTGRGRDLRRLRLVSRRWPGCPREDAPRGVCEGLRRPQPTPR